MSRQPFRLEQRLAHDTDDEIDASAAWLWNWELAPGGGQPALGELLKKDAAFSKLNIIKWTKADVQIC